MGSGKANCAVCGKPLAYFEEAQRVQCAICGADDLGHSICVDGHYVCDSCHRAGGVRFIMETCRQSDSTDPIRLAQQMMSHQSIYPNGPEHHTLIGVTLLTAYKNAGGEVDLDSALDELQMRSMQVPGGSCGFWGCCGAATSAGQFYSIISGSTPMARDSWGETARLTSRIMGRLADVGGPRCCKRTGFMALEEAVSYVAETRGVVMDRPERIVCTFKADNAECLGRECPYSGLL